MARPPPCCRVPGALRGTIGLPEFLAETCLSYCEFYELWQSGFVVFSNGAREGDGEGEFPQCEPCCLDDLSLVFPEGQQEQDLPKLLVFIRLWRKLRDSCCFCYSFAQLRDICDVLQLYKGGALNPDFVRQLAAFQMLRDHFAMDLTDPDDKPAPGAIDADRTHLLALWVGPAAAEVGVGATAADQRSGTSRTAAATTASGAPRTSSSCWPPISIRCRGWPGSTPPPLPGTRCPRTRCGSPKCWRRSMPLISPSAS